MNRRDDDLAALLARARDGDAAAREELIRRYRPFVMRIAAEVAGRYVTPGVDEEASVGMLAFDEALRAFDPARGAAFLPFSEMVVRRRLVDHLRRESARRSREVPLTELEREDDDGSVSAPALDSEAIARSRAADEEWERREEIRAYAGALSAFGISFAELTRISPRHADARERAIEAARRVAEVPEFAAHLRARRQLPLRELAAEAAVSLKTLERQRKYIIAVALILMGDYPHLRAYLRV